MNSNNRFKTLLKNISPKQKIGFAAGLLILIILVIIIVGISRITTVSEEETAANPAEETYVDGQGNTIVKKTYTNEEGETVVNETKEDRYGNVTTTDPQLITTYFPYQVMREHADYTPTLKYFLAINDETGVIRVNMEDCDVENDKKEIKQYLDSIPLDLSIYTIEYELINTDTDCEY